MNADVHVQKDCAQQRLKVFLRELGELQQVDFPYPDSGEAIELLFDRFSGYLGDLEVRIDPDNEQMIFNVCVTSLREMALYLPLVGFINRSTHPRNSFEAYGVLRALAKSLLGNDTRLILSSEWDFSPFVYSHVPGLSGFVLVASPAHEASNPLLLPLAGHEFGHPLWVKHNLQTLFGPAVERLIIDKLRSHPGFKESDGEEMGTLGQLSPAYDFVLKQIEESFCDFIGTWIFGTSFLRAFQYLLSPNTGGSRALIYPEPLTRARNLATAAVAFGYDVPEQFVASFEDRTRPAPLDRHRYIHGAIADQVLAEMIRASRTCVG
jgi:hypothetical protein